MPVKKNEKSWKEKMEDVKNFVDAQEPEEREVIFSRHEDREREMAIPHEYAPMTPTRRQEPRPPMNSKSPKKCLGSYVGIAVDRHHVDLEKIGQDLYNAGYNAISFFLTTCFHNTDPVTYPWSLKDGKFDFTKINQDWYDWLYKVIETFAYYRIQSHICFVDQFHEIGDNPKPDPFRQGLFGNKEFTADPLYSSVTFAPTKFWWLKWTDATGGRYKNFQTIGDFGKGMELYVDAVVDIIWKVKQLKNPAGKPLYPDFSVAWKWANETFATYDPATNHAQNVRGDRDEIVQWIWDKFRAKEFSTGPKYRPYFDYFCRDKSGAPRDPYYPAMAEEQYWIWRKYCAHLEIHGVLTTSAVQKYDNAVFKKGALVYSLDANKTLFSTDGDLKMVAEYSELGHSKYHVDLKLDTTSGHPFFPDNYQMFWDTYFPKYRNYIKG